MYLLGPTQSCGARIHCPDHPAPNLFRFPLLLMSEIRMSLSGGSISVSRLVRTLADSQLFIVCKDRLVSDLLRADGLYSGSPSTLDISASIHDAR